jgi:hypothetical protein
VSEKRILRRIFGSNGKELIEHWKKLHNEELRKYYHVNQNTENGMDGACSSPGRGGKKRHIEFSLKSQMGRNHLQGVGVGGRIILKSVLKK